jgi:hypothetical protein
LFAALHSHLLVGFTLVGGSLNFLGFASSSLQRNRLALELHFHLMGM